MARIELRAEPERVEAIREAARLAKKSVSSFVLEAATERAQEVIQAAMTTTVPGDFFDELHQSLGESPVPNSALQQAARRRRRVVQA